MTSTEIALRPAAAPISNTRTRVVRMSRVAFALAASMSVSACSGFLPGVGPNSGDILSSSGSQTIDYAIAKLDAKAVLAAREADPIPFGEQPAFRQARPVRTSLIGRGDVLSIAIWEPVADGLLTAAGAKQAAIQDVVVDDRGHIFVPYAGSIHAAGRTTETVRKLIVAELKDKTTDPQVTVSRSQYRSRGVSFQGAVGQPGVKPLEPLVGRLLPMLATAGGATSPANSTKITLRRGAASVSAFLDHVYSDPDANIALRNGDIVLVENQSRYFNAFGSVARSGRQAMQTSDMSLLSAISQVGGLDGQSANITGVFVFRREPEGVVSQLTRIDKPKKEDAPERVTLGDDKPVIYQLAMNSADAMFVADAFKVREGDTLYVTEAPYAQFRKVLSVIVPTLGTAGSVNSLATTTGN